MDSEQLIHPRHHKDNVLYKFFTTPTLLPLYNDLPIVRRISTLEVVIGILFSQAINGPVHTVALDIPCAVFVAGIRALLIK